MIYLRSSVSFFCWQFHAGYLCEGLNRLAKLHPLVIHYKAQRVATCTAAKAVVELFILGNSERGAFLFVKGAAGLVVFAGLFQLDTTVDHVDYIDAIEQVINKCLGYSSSHQALQNALN